MSDRILPVLSISCGTLTVSYMVLVAMTVFFAAWQTQAVSSVRTMQASIASLEVQYYSATNHINSMDPTSLGFVTPSQIQYVAQAKDNSSGLSFNGN